jgi:hypothetical protein
MSGERYERADIRFRSILQALVLLVVGLAVVLVLTWFTYLGFRQTYESRDARRSLAGRAAEEPPRPRLEISPAADYERYFHAQSEALNTYGWASRSERKARIPIERAMELLVERKGAGQ